jgi:hypothetical protein
MSFPAPKDLLEALHSGSAPARAELTSLCRGPIRDLVQEIDDRLGLNQDIDRLTAYALHWAEMYLRTQEPARFDRLAPSPDQSWEVFGELVRWKVSQMLWEPIPAGRWLRWCPGWLRRVVAIVWRRRMRRTRTRVSVPAALPDSAVFAASVFSQPHDLVGGDWCTTTRDGDTLWVLLADVCGKSWPAYILSRGLQPLWNVCLSGQPVDPVAMLTQLDGHLERCLPEALFVEVTVARCSARPQEQIEVAAGGKSLVLRRDALRGTVDWQVLGGPYLGLGLGGPFDRVAWPVQAGDEVLLASDGLLDQPAGSGRLEAALKPPVLSPDGSATLHETVVRLLREALREHPQFDDVTAVTVRRR